MKRYKKGIESRGSILVSARQVLNDQGLNITVDTLSKALGLTRGRITHFFPTREDLMVAIMRDYEHALGETIQNFDWGRELTFEKMFGALELILEVQYEYRCALSYVCITNRHQHEMHQHIEASFMNRIDNIMLRLRAMVHQGLLIPAILEKPSFDIYCFQFTNLLTTWVVSQELYFSKRGVEKMKPLYIRSAMDLYLPYLSLKGKKAYTVAVSAFNQKYQLT